MNKLQVGYGETNINPPLGTSITGYYIPRFAKGFLDDLEVSAIVMACDDTRIAVISVDSCFLDKIYIDRFIETIEKNTGIKKENVFLSVTHTHTGPGPLLGGENPPEEEEKLQRYYDFLEVRISDAVKLALLDLKPAKMGYIVGWAPERVAYIRRYKMKDGTTMTCPPVGDPNIDHPIGELDQRVNVLRFDRDGAESIVIVNYGLHVDTVNGDLISSDWAGWMRRTLDKALDGVKSMLICGAQGDVGSTNVHPKAGDMNDTEISFDNEMKSPGMARFVGRAIAGTVLQVYDKVNYVDVDEIKYLHNVIKIPSNIPNPEDLPLAHKYKELHDAGKDDEIPYESMELTTVVAEAARMCRLENGPDFFELDLSGIKLGSVALIGIPGEPFTDIGVGIKDTEGWELIMPCALVNGSMGYFPMKSAYDEGGYEARSSSFKSGVAERIIEGGKALLEQLDRGVSKR